MKISALGLGCMGMSESDRDISFKQSVEVINKAISFGINFFDSSDSYGMGANEELLGKVFKNRRPDFVIATKFGFVYGPKGNICGINGNPEYVKKACEQSLKRLNTDYIDIYYMHRIDRSIPLEETVGAMSRLVEEGKIKAIGFCEISKESLKKVNSIFPVSALQSEYSIWSRDIEEDIIPECRKNKISVIPYSPLGKGFLAGAINSWDNISNKDKRKNLPRFKRDNLSKNLSKLKLLKEASLDLNCSVAQLSLAWLNSRGDDIIPIPGTVSTQHLEENVKSLELKVDNETLGLIDEIYFDISGDRLDPFGMKFINM